MIIEISVAVIAIAFVVLVIYLILLSKAIRVTLHQVNQTLVGVRQELEGINGQAQKVLEHTNEISFDLKRKSEALNPLFNALANVGEILEHKTYVLKKEALASSHEEGRSIKINSEEIGRLYQTHELTKVADILDLVGLGCRLWHKIKKRR
jgi:uncharacterized protein YoxC